MEDSLDSIQVFANSANSVEVFKALTCGPATSKSLTEQTEASRSTVARILNEGESRGWIDSEGTEYELTYLGETMINEFHDYLQTIEGINHLGKAIYWLPPPARKLDFRYFRDATIITATDTNPARPFDYMAQMIRNSTEKRSLVETAVPRLAKIVDEHARDAAEKQLDAELVIKASWFDSLAMEPEQMALWRARAERGGVWAYEGDIPINMEIFDESVVIWLGENNSDELVVRGLLVVENPTVRRWAESLYEEYQAEANPLNTKMLPEV